MGQGAESGGAKGGGGEFVKFSRSSAQRIAKTVRTVEGGNRNQPGLTFEHPMPTTGSPVRLCKSGASTWTKGSTRTVDVWEAGECGSESQSTGVTIAARNLYANIPANNLCSVARHGNGCWYVIASEMVYRDVITGVELQANKLRFTRTRIWTLGDETQPDPLDIAVANCPEDSGGGGGG
jgi:hypothetical protein